MALPHPPCVVVTLQVMEKNGSKFTRGVTVLTRGVSGTRRPRGQRTSSLSLLHRQPNTQGETNGSLVWLLSYCATTHQLCFLRTYHTQWLAILLGFVYLSSNGILQIIQEKEAGAAQGAHRSSSSFTRGNTAASATSTGSVGRPRRRQ